MARTLLALVGAFVLAATPGVPAAQVPAGHEPAGGDATDLSSDPYRWLEEMRSPEVRDWSHREDARARAYAAGWPGRNALRDRIMRAAEHYRYLKPIRAGERYFFARVNSTFTRVSLLVQHGLAGPITALIPAEAFEAEGLVVDRTFWPSPDGTLLAYGVAAPGSRWVEIRFREVASGRDLPDRLRGSRGGNTSNVSWAPDGRGVYYDAFAVPRAEDRLSARVTGARVAFHRLGTPDSTDRVLLGPYGDGRSLYQALTDDGRWLVVTDADGAHPGNRLVAFDVARRDPRPRVLVEGRDEVFTLVGSEGGELWLYTQADAPNGRVVGITVGHPERRRWRDIVPERPFAIDTWAGLRAVGRVVVVAYRERGLLRLRTFAPGVGGSDELPMPDLGSVWFGFTGRQRDSELFFSVDGFVDPGTVYRHDLASGRTTVFRSPELPYDPRQVITRQVFYRGPAGDSIPMYLAYHAGMEPDGRRPVMIYGYAFGGWSASPWFRPHMEEWFGMGGVFALPALRGGGEFGQAWADAGIRRNRQHAVDDFLAAAEWLVARGLAPADGLIAETNSAGASVVGAAIVQRPQLFRAALLGFPLLDLLRYEAFTGGAAWRSQLGTVEDPADLAALRRYSPVHNVRPGLCYPAVLAAPGELDETTPPFHAYKFVAALQHGQRCMAPILLRVSFGAGHAYGSDQVTTVDNYADQLAFVQRILAADHAR
jgi:prolyl oligopeptidase